MGQTSESAKLTANKLKEKYGDDYYSRLGYKGGKNSKDGGFAKDIPCKCDLILQPHFVRQCAPKRGGMNSRKPKP